MAKLAAICEQVEDGDTMRISGGGRIRLARVNAPETDTPAGQEAKQALEGLVLSKPIVYESVETDTDGRTVAEVWFEITNINDHMRSLGFK